MIVGYSTLSFDLRPFTTVASIMLIYSHKAVQSLLIPGHLATSETKFFDLGYDLDETSVFYPGQRFEYELYKDVEGYNLTSTPIPIQYWFSQYSFCMGEHGGTHIDAPFHFNKNGWKVGEIPLNRLMDVPAAIIDVEKHVFALEKPQQFKLEVNHILQHENEHGRIPLNGIVLVHFGWGRYWKDKNEYLGKEQNGSLNFPGLSGNAAKWLVEQRNIVGLGVDSASADVGNYMGHLPVHLTLCGNQVYIIENVANLGTFLKKIRTCDKSVIKRKCNFRLTVLPIKSKGTGGPTRVIAICK